MTPELRFDRLLEFFGKEKKEEEREKVKVEEKEEIREIEVKEKFEETALDKEGEFLVFSSENEYYALPLKKVKEIYPSMDLIEIQGLPEYIIGFAKYKGKMVPVVDIFSIMEINPSNSKNYVGIEVEKNPLFLLIGKIEGIVKENRDNVFEVPFNLDREMFSKLIYQDGKLIGCLNPDYFAKINKKILERLKKNK